MTQTYEQKGIGLKKGFTIIELMIVISIISMISAIVIPKYSNVTSEAKVANVQANLSNLNTAIEMYRLKNEKYPDLEGTQDNLGEFSEFYSKSKMPDTPYFESGTENNDVSSGRSNDGGWLYFIDEGEMYADLPNGAYTGDTVNEIWNDESSNTEISEEVVEYTSNSSFENFAIGLNKYKLINADLIDGWSTTASDNKIEIWGDGFNGVSAADGSYFVELNGTQSASIYQEIETTPGTTLTWTISHMGRVGEDVATISVGDGTESIVLETMTDGNTEWGTYTGTYVVPEGQTTTTFYVDAVSTSTGSKSVGNFIDAFSVTSQ